MPPILKHAIGCLILLSLLASASVAEGKRYALVVGVKRYDGKTFIKLPSAEQDALALDPALRALGFNTVVTMTSEADLPVRRPVSAKNILDQLDGLLKNKDASDTVLVFLSGHGIQLKGDKPDANGNKETYFCPEEARVRDRSSLVPISVVMQKLAACPVERKLLLIDSCREEMLADDAPEKAGGTIELDPVGVKRPPPPAGLAALFSCGPGETSRAFKDLGQGASKDVGHGAFTHFTLKYLRGEADARRYQNNQLPITELAAYVSRETHDYVFDKLGTQQTPELLVPGGLRPWSLGELARLTDLFAGKSAGEAKELAPGTKFRWCPAGTFTMGMEDATNDEAPVQVTLSRGFWLCETEVTQGQFRRVMQSTPWKSETDVRDVKEGSDYAASYISYDDAVAYCEKLTAQEKAAGRLPAGWKYALPTEAQWEYACRAGTTTKYSFGDEESRLGDYGWWGGFVGEGNAKTEQYAHRVGQKKSNPWGLRDMHGNVWEWCADWYGEKLPGGHDPVGVPAGLGRVLRGGGWGNGAIICRSAIRSSLPPDLGIFEQGFRVAGVPSSE